MSPNSSPSRDAELRDRVAAFLEQQFPQIRMHGGSAAITRLNADNGEVRIQLSGACSGCGLSPMTIQALKSRITDEVPQLTDVTVTTTESLDETERNVVP